MREGALSLFHLARTALIPMTYIKQLNKALKYSSGQIRSSATMQDSGKRE